MGFFKKAKAIKDIFFGKRKNDELNKLLQKSSENIEMKKDINQLINELKETVESIEIKTGKDNYLGETLAYNLTSLIDSLENNVSNIDVKHELEITDIKKRIDAVCSLRGKGTKLATKRRDEVSQSIQKILDVFYHLGLNKETIELENKKDGQSIEPVKHHVTTPIQVKSDIKVTNKTRDDDTNGWNVLMKGLVSKLDVMGKEVLDLISKSRNDLYNKIVTVDSSVITLSNKVEKKLDLNVKVTIDSATAIKSELDKVSKSIPNDVLKKGDFSFELDNKFRELDSLKEVAEELESLPAHNKFIKSELSNINEKLDNLSAPSASDQSSVKVPDEVQAVEDLATYMRDGVAQFENMSRLYVSKMSELENLDKVKEQHQAEILKAEKASAEQGKLESRVSLAKEISEKFPSEFKVIKSIFESVITERYVTGEIINVTNENKNEMMPYFSMELELAEYEVITPAILIDRDITFTANIKKVPQPVTETVSADATPEVSVGVTVEASADAIAEVSAGVTAEASADVTAEASVGVTAEVSAGVTAEVSVDTAPEKTPTIVVKED